MSVTVGINKLSIMIQKSLFQYDPKMTHETPLFFIFFLEKGQSGYKDLIL